MENEKKRVKLSSETGIYDKKTRRWYSEIITYEENLKNYSGDYVAERIEER